ncbi:MAG TPA: PAS domain-containing protein, partial [Polyangiaceae bacterium]|nr:PAS domain-containing protein [Polyangiaceae bacterium]
MSTSSSIRMASLPSLSWDHCRLLVESVVDYAIFMLDAEGRVTTWNVGAEKIKGYRPDEIIGEHFSKFYTEEDLAVQKPEREIEQARAHGRVEDEGWRVRKDGSRFWANVVITALRDETGTLRGYGKVTRDLTAKKAVEDELRRAEQRFHHLVDAVSDYAIFMLDDTGHVATWNLGACRVKGYSPEEIIGKHFSTFYTPEDRAAGKPERILDTVRREGRYQEQGWRVRKDGVHFWASVVITALRDETGKLLGFAKVTQDLTDRRRAEEELRRSEERFRLIVENVVDYAIYMLDTEGCVATWNLGAERMKGYTAAEIIGQNFARFFPEEDIAAQKPARELAAAREHGRFEDEGWRVRKDGSRFWANAILTALHDARGELIGFAKITRDLTDRRNVEEKNRLLVREQTAREVAEEAEARLRESEARYRALSNRLEIVLEGVADGITVQDRTGRVVFANSAAAKICGFSSGQELMDTPPAEVVARFQMLDVEGKPFTVENLPGRLAMAGKGPTSAVVHVRERASGRDWWVLIRASAVFDAAGEPELAINIWHDVTTDHREERASQYLAQATSVLASSLVHEEMLTTFGRLLVPGLGDWCSIYLLEGHSVRQVAVAHADPAKAGVFEEYQRLFPPDPQHVGGVWSVIHSGGKSQVYNDITEEMLASSAPEPERLATLRALGPKAALLVAISVRDRVLGVIALLSADPHRR